MPEKSKPKKSPLIAIIKEIVQLFTPCLPVSQTLSLCLKEHTRRVLDESSTSPRQTLDHGSNNKNKPSKRSRSWLEHE